jgi:RimJ/RimL family protein N-acetyltransferase
MNKIITGKNINLHLVEIADAEFILNLRLKKGEFLSATNPNLKEQENWIKSYKKREELKEEYYFIIKNKNGLKTGTIRLYDINYKTKTFTFGSFIVDREIEYTHKLSAFEAMNLIFDFAFEKLSLNNCFFDCRKNNHKANNFYIRFGAKIIKKDEIDYFYNFSIDDYHNLENKI